MLRTDGLIIVLAIFLWRDCCSATLIIFIPYGCASGTMAAVGAAAA